TEDPPCRLDRRGRRDTARQLLRSEACIRAAEWVEDVKGELAAAVCPAGPQTGQQGKRHRDDDAPRPEHEPRPVRLPVPLNHAAPFLATPSQRIVCRTSSPLHREKPLSEDRVSSRPQCPLAASTCFPV